MILLIILGMSLATMLPRVIPAFVVEKMQFRPWINRWLQGVPYAALGALIFPGILTVFPDRPHIGLMGAIAAIILSLAGLNIILVVTGGILTVFLFSL